MLDWAIVGCRLIQFFACDVLFGSALFFLYGLAERSGPDTFPAARGRALLLIAALSAFAATVVWFIAETMSLTAAGTDADPTSALWSVLSQTRFGRFAVLRLGILTVSIAALRMDPRIRRVWVTQGALGAVLVASFAWTGHGAMNVGIVGLLHLTNDVGHLLTAALWLGALVPLSMLLVRFADPVHPDAAREIALALTRFSGVAPAVVAVLVLTGVINTGLVIGLPGWRDFWASTYCCTLAAKIGLFVLMLALAAANRYTLLPQFEATLAGSGSIVRAVRRLRMSVVMETVLAVLVIAAVAFLGTTEPPGSDL